MRQSRNSTTLCSGFAFIAKQKPFYGCLTISSIKKRKENIMDKFKELIASDIPVLVDFFAEWCGPCKTMTPILHELKSMKGEKVRIVKIDVDKHQELASYYQIQSVPTLMIFKDGKQLWRQSGVIRANDLSNILAEYE